MDLAFALGSNKINGKQASLRPGPGGSNKLNGHAVHAGLKEGSRHRDAVGETPGDQPQGAIIGIPSLRRDVDIRGPAIVPRDDETGCAIDLETIVRPTHRVRVNHVLRRFNLDPIHKSLTSQATHVGDPEKVLAILSWSENDAGVQQLRTLQTVWDNRLAAVSPRCIVGFHFIFLVAHVTKPDPGVQRTPQPAGKHANPIAFLLVDGEPKDVLLAWSGNDPVESCRQCLDGCHLVGFLQDIGIRRNSQRQSRWRLFRLRARKQCEVPRFCRQRDDLLRRATGVAQQTQLGRRPRPTTQGIRDQRPLEPTDMGTVIDPTTGLEQLLANMNEVRALVRGNQRSNRILDVQIAVILFHQDFPVLVQDPHHQIVFRFCIRLVAQSNRINLDRQSLSFFQLDTKVVIIEFAGDLDLAGNRATQRDLLGGFQRVVRLDDGLVVGRHNGLTAPVGHLESTSFQFRDNGKRTHPECCDCRECLGGAKPQSVLAQRTVRRDHKPALDPVANDAAMMQADVSFSGRHVFKVDGLDARPVKQDLFRIPDVPSFQDHLDGGAPLATAWPQQFDITLLRRESTITQARHAHEQGGDDGAGQSGLHV